MTVRAGPPAVAPRYAVYYAPPAAHPLWRLGSAWLGRDARAGQPAGRPPPLREQPWRYGFHATLKAPLRLRDGCDERGFIDAVAALAAAQAPFEMPPLQVAPLADFVALRPLAEPAAQAPLRALADACVRTLDAFRAPPDAAERLRRIAAPGADALPAAESAAQRAAVEHWGYPHVFERWRLHFTLSDALPAAPRERLLRQAQAHFAAALAEPLACDALCVFVEPAPGAPFVLGWRFAFGAR